MLTTSSSWLDNLLDNFLDFIVLLAPFDTAQTISASHISTGSFALEIHNLASNLTLNLLPSYNVFLSQYCTTLLNLLHTAAGFLKQDMMLHSVKSSF